MRACDQLTSPRPTRRPKGRQFDCRNLAVCLHASLDEPLLMDCQLLPGGATSVRFVSALAGNVPSWPRAGLDAPLRVEGALDALCYFRVRVGQLFLLPQACTRALGI